MKYDNLFNENPSTSYDNSHFDYDQIYLDYCKQTEQGRIEREAIHWVNGIRYDSYQLDSELGYIRSRPVKMTSDEYLLYKNIQEFWNLYDNKELTEITNNGKWAHFYNISINGQFYEAEF